MSRHEVDQDLEETRSRGYAVNKGEFRPGVCGIAVPVRDRGGNVVASIGLWGAEKNILGARRDELARLVMAAARDISRNLGYIEPTQERAPKRVAEAELQA
jgi:IclR family acetate operon transcriptional repressor